MHSRDLKQEESLSVFVFAADSVCFQHFIQRFAANLNIIPDLFEQTHKEAFFARFRLHGHKKHMSNPIVIEQHTTNLLDIRHYATCIKPQPFLALCLRYYLCEIFQHLWCLAFKHFCFGFATCGVQEKRLIYRSNQSRATFNGDEKRRFKTHPFPDVCHIAVIAVCHDQKNILQVYLDRLAFQSPPMNFHVKLACMSKSVSYTHLTLPTTPYV